MPYHKAIERERINAQRGGGGGGPDDGGDGGRGDDEGDGGGGGSGGDDVAVGDDSEGNGTRDVGQQTDPTIGEYGMSLLLYGVAITTAAAPFIARIMSSLKRETSR